jgi:hypothetical protein
MKVANSLKQMLKSSSEVTASVKTSARATWFFPEISIPRLENSSFAPVATFEKDFKDSKNVSNPWMFNFIFLDMTSSSFVFYASTKAVNTKNMEIRSYNHELEFANLLFKKLFSNITIEKWYGNNCQQIPVRCMIGNRSRIFKDLENPEKKATYTFPLLIITRGGITSDPDRIANLNNEVKFQTSPTPYGINYNLLTPHPITISYTVTILSKDQATNDMIVSNFISFFNQDLFVSCIHPKFNNVKYNSQVIFGGSITDEHPEELTGDQDDFVTTTCEFTFRTYIFGGTDKANASPYISVDTSDPNNPISVVIYDGFTPIIKSIMLDIHAVPYLDSTLPWVISTYTGYVLSTDEDGNVVLSGEGDTRGPVYKRDENGDLIPISVNINVLSGVYNPYVRYSVDKYFNDISEGKTWPEAVDTLRWYIDEDDGKFKQVSTDIVAKTWFNPTDPCDPFDLTKVPFSVLTGWK